uniref:Cytoplasmic tRNA 2-thiolation protein 2 n=1 Tax=Manihot esculenta TaxID=3983 RepID=A0A2C9VDP3_MANES
MQHRAQKNFDAMAFIDECAVYPVASEQVDDAIREMKLDRLTNLPSAVNEAAGKEDILLHLRMVALQKVASENGYTRLILGLCTSRLAGHVLAATIKGQGYYLSADIQYIDARWEVPVGSLKTLPLLNSAPTGINSLVSSFVTRLQLKSLLHFNRIPEIKGVGKDTISSPLSFCPICNNPRKDSDLLSLESHESCQSSRFAAAAAACSSCCFQILLKGALNNGTFLQQLQDCLFSDSEDET